MFTTFGDYVPFKDMYFECRLCTEHLRCPTPYSRVKDAHAVQWSDHTASADMEHQLNRAPCTQSLFTELLHLARLYEVAKLGSLGFWGFSTFECTCTEYMQDSEVVCKYTEYGVHAR